MVYALFRHLEDELEEGCEECVGRQQSVAAAAEEGGGGRRIEETRLGSAQEWCATCKASSLKPVLPHQSSDSSWTHVSKTQTLLDPPISAPCLIALARDVCWTPRRSGLIVRVWPASWSLSISSLMKVSPSSVKRDEAGRWK